MLIKIKIGRQEDSNDRFLACCRIIDKVRAAQAYRSPRPCSVARSARAFRRVAILGQLFKKNVRVRVCAALSSYEQHVKL